MAVVAVPDRASRGAADFGFADVVLESLEQLDAVVLDALDDRRPLPTLSRPRFHLAFGVDDLSAAREFYVGVLGCEEGRSDETWVDFDLWGHQIVAHLDREVALRRPPTNDVDGHEVPASHFGLVLPAGAWSALAARLAAAGVTFLMEPTVRFAGTSGEQRTMFVLDPAGNAIELKSFADDRQVFAAG
jgi:extradiol dioxygenase family protein